MSLGQCNCTDFGGGTFAVLPSKCDVPRLFGVSGGHFIVPCLSS